jgi:hypothetical protein
MSILVRVSVSTRLAVARVAAGVADGAAVGEAEGLAFKKALGVTVAGGIVAAGGRVVGVKGEAAGTRAGVLGAHALAKIRTAISPAPRKAIKKEPGGYTAFIENFL